MLDIKNRSIVQYLYVLLKRRSRIEQSLEANTQETEMYIDIIAYDFDRPLWLRWCLTYTALYGVPICTTRNHRTVYIDLYAVWPHQEMFPAGSSDKPEGNLLQFSSHRSTFLQLF